MQQGPRRAEAGTKDDATGYSREMNSMELDGEVKKKTRDTSRLAISFVSALAAALSIKLRLLDLLEDFGVEDR